MIHCIAISHVSLFRLARIKAEAKKQKACNVLDHSAIGVGPEGFDT